MPAIVLLPGPDREADGFCFLGFGCGVASASGHGGGAFESLRGFMDGEGALSTVMVGNVGWYGYG